MSSPYCSKDIFKQLEEVMNKCDNLSLEMKTQKKEYEERIDQLEHRVEELESENDKLRNDNDRMKKQLNNDSNNSSKPPSSDIKKNIPNNRNKTNKKKGAQQGHKAYFLGKKDIETKIRNKEIEHEVIHMGNIQNEYISKYIVDIQVKTVAKEYRFYKDNNGKYNIPKEFKTDVQYGNELKTMCSILNTEGIVAIDRLTNFVGCISHESIKISNGTIVNFIKELGKKSKYITEEIKEKILNSELMHTDATTARCENRNISVRNYSTEKHTLLVPTYGKGRKYIEETGILNKYTGSLIHDHETVIYNYGSRHIECNVHVLRYLKGCAENTNHKWALKLRSFMLQMNEYRKQLKNKGIDKLTEEQISRYRKRYDELLEEGYEENKKIKKKYLRQEEQRLLNRLKKYKENHLMFLCDFSVPFDNNLSERELRHIKIKQKVSGYFNSLEGIINYSNIKSIILTLKKQGRNFYNEIFNIYENIPVEI